MSENLLDMPVNFETAFGNAKDRSSIRKFDFVNTAKYDWRARVNPPGQAKENRYIDRSQRQLHMHCALPVHCLGWIGQHLKQNLGTRQAQRWHFRIGGNL
ncbi:uncharacterized protein G2W53_012663 [Senna tora]|uniref:Uncharacterized protein n=1 Tax=Senna tora TaxID=362788 RepID=A0A834WNS0_9FABA|nr:uncharacterized protein G2W53_012663 [Senna tora]